MRLNENNIDQDLLSRLINGDLQAFDHIYGRYSHKLFSFIFKILKNETEAEDVMQEVFVKIWESKEKLEDDKLLDSYIFTIAYNSSISLIRKRINNRKYIDYLRNSSVFENTPATTSELEFNELNKLVEKTNPKSSGTAKAGLSVAPGKRSYLS